MERGATEIHWLPGGETAGVFHRIGGRLVHVGQEPRNATTDLIERIAALGGPILEVGRFSAAGRVVCPVGSCEIALDVSLLGCDQGIAVRLGLYPQLDAKLDSLGLAPLDVARLRDVVARPHGLVIVTGPPQSGRTTTLRALAATVDRNARVMLGFVGGEWPSSSTLRMNLTSARARERWADIVVAHNADVVVLDDVFVAEHLAGVLSSAAAERLLLISTDACNLETLFECLLRRSGGSALAADRLHVVIEQRMSRTASAGADTHSSPTFDVRFMSDRLRELLRERAPIHEVCAAVRAEASAGAASSTLSLPTGAPPPRPRA
jgi:hypothetical protein